MNEVCSGDNKSNRVFTRIRSRGVLLWDGLCRNVRSSVTISINFESSIALLVCYAVVGANIAMAIKGASG